MIGKLLLTVIATLTLPLTIASAAQVDWERTIRVGKSEVYNLVGTADAKTLREYLKPMGKVPKSILGRTPVILSVFQNDDVEGCGCPADFHEFTLIYVLEGSSEKGEIRIAPDLQLTDHIQRQTSVAFKFGTMVSMGQVGFLDNNRTGFFIKDATGASILKAKPFSGMPSPFKNEMIRYESHSLGGTQMGQNLVRTITKIAGPIRSGYKPYVAGLDTFDVNPNSKLSLQLKRIGFVPHYWQTMSSTSNMWLWLKEWL